MTRLLAMGCLLWAGCGDRSDPALEEPLNVVEPTPDDTGEPPAEAPQCVQNVHIPLEGRAVEWRGREYCLLDEPLCEGDCPSLGQLLRAVRYFECPTDFYDRRSVRRCEGGPAAGYHQVSESRYGYDENWLYAENGSLIRFVRSHSPNHEPLCCSGWPMMYRAVKGRLVDPDCTEWETLSPADFGVDFDPAQCP